MTRKTASAPVTAASPAHSARSVSSKTKIGKISEATFANSILEWAKVYGWRCFHVRNSGYKGKSFVQGQKGFPDLIMMRKSGHPGLCRCIAAELKVKGNHATNEQVEWLHFFEEAGWETYVWYPTDWNSITQEVLP